VRSIAACWNLDHPARRVTLEAVRQAISHFGKSLKK